MNTKIKQNKGITLISLVVTIIVLIILAGITLNMIMGEDGILKRAKEAKPIQDVATAKEQLELLKGPIYIDKHEVTLDNYVEKLTEEADKYKASNIKVVNEKNATVLIDDKYKFLITTDDIDGKNKNGDLLIIYQGEATGLVLSATSGTMIHPDTLTFEIIDNESKGELSVESENENIATATIEGTKVTVTSQGLAGTVKIIVRSAANNGFAGGQATYEATVENGTITLDATPYTGIYDGNEHDAITSITVNPSDAKIEYALNGGEYSQEIPKVTDASEYSVTIKASKEGYTTKIITKTVAIGTKETGDFTVTLGQTEYTYDGTAKTPTVTVKEGSKTLISGTDYTVEYTNNINVGTATVTVTGKGNYTGTTSKTFTINAQLVTGITLNKTTTTIIKGNTETLIATVSPTYANNKTLTWSSSDTSVATVSNGTVTAVAAGTATITATAQDGSGKSASCVVTVDTEKLYLIQKGIAQVGFSKWNIYSITECLNMEGEVYTEVNTKNIGERAYYYTTDKIDLSEYSTIKVDLEIDRITASDGGTSIGLGVVKTTVSNHDYETYLRIAGQNDSDRFSRNLYTLDIQDITTSHRITVYKNNTEPDNSRAIFYVYDLWLEK